MKIAVGLDRNAIKAKGRRRQQTVVSRNQAWSQADRAMAVYKRVYR